MQTLNFLLATEVDRLCTDRKFVSKYLKSFREILARRVAGPLESLLASHLLMPGVGYPNMSGRALASGDEFLHDLGAGPTRARLILFPLGKSRCLVQLGPFEVAVRAEGGGHTILTDGREVRSRGPHIELNLILRDDGAAAFLHDTLLSTSSSSRGSIAVRPTEGEMAVAQVQVLGRQPSLFRAERDAVVDVGQTPYRYRWETDSHRLYQSLLHAKVALELAGVAKHPDMLRRDIIGYATECMEALQAWPVWTAATRPTADTGTWDRNNWATGFVGGAYAVAASICGAPDEAVRAEFQEKTGLWLSRDSFPRPDHWVRRSTNHGIVIYSAHLTGALLLGMGDLPEVRRLGAALDETLRRSLEDGSFIEGSAYYTFAMGHAFVYYWLLWRLSGEEWRSFCDERLDFLRAVPGFLAHAVGSRGDPWVRFGERHQRHWSRNAALRLTLAAAGRPPGSDHLPVRPTPGEAIGPLSYLAAVPKPAPEPRLSVLIHFPRNHLAGIDYFRDGTKIGTLSVIGSLLQRTHNHFHDCGAFSLEIDGLPVADLVGSTDPSAASPLAALVGGEIRSLPGYRNYHGVVDVRSVAEDTHVIVARATFPRAVARELGLVDLVRTFVSIGAPHPEILAVTAVGTVGEAVPVLRVAEADHPVYRFSHRLMFAEAADLPLRSMDGPTRCYASHGARPRLLGRRAGRGPDRLVHCFLTRIAPIGAEPRFTCNGDELHILGADGARVAALTVRDLSEP